MKFSHLHVHTEYSLLNGAIRIPLAIKKAKEWGMPALAMTDYGNIFGAVEFFQQAKKEGIKPILGCEVFLPNYNDHHLKEFKRGQTVYWQLVLLVKNKIGYKNLSQLLTQSYLEGFYYKPRVDTKLLQQFSEGLIALSSGCNSEINHHLFEENREAALKAIQKYQQIFPGRYYIELQDNGLPGQVAMNQELKTMANEAGVPYVATNNVHYLNRDDAEAFEVLRGIQMGATVKSPYDQLKFSTDAYHFRSTEEMQMVFADMPEALEVTQKIVDECNFDFDYDKYHLPQYAVPQGKTLDDYFTEQTQTGFENLWPHIKEVSQVSESEKITYLARLSGEIDVIKKMGFSGYFLIVADFINWAKENGIPVGPGRGSGAGSLVAYCLRITNLDPLPYHLLFERFLNPERISMPDFDIDFCQDRRGAVIDYVTQKYGNVSQIITFGKMKAKAVIRDVGRVMELEYDYVDKIAKMIPNELNITLEKALELEPELRALYQKDETVHRLIDTSLRLEGLSRHASVHAAGVIITDQALWNFVPLYKGSSDDVVIQFDFKNAESIGLIKFDFLGLKTLTVIKNAIDKIAQTKNQKIDIDTIPMHDKKVYELLCRGDGCGIFQLESSGMCELMKRLKPNRFEDIIALVALYRPGPLGSGMVDDFIARKRGERAISYDLPELEKNLKDTYGVIVYQEQVMQIAAILANYTLGEADLLRRAMGKKKKSEMAAQRKRFIEGATQNQISLAKSEKIFDLMAKFAEYGFNKSHSAAYALISYQTAYLKTHFCAEYMAALLTSEKADTDKLLVFMRDSQKHGIEFLAPNINQCGKDFDVRDGKITYALAAIKGVGEAAIEAIVEARKNGSFKSLFDFCSRVDLRRVTKKVFEMLIKAGAFDEFGISRKAMFLTIDNFVDAAARQQKNRELGQFDLFSKMDSESQTPMGISIHSEEDWLESEKLAFEKEAFGFYFSNHPLSPFAFTLEKLITVTVVEIPDKRHEEAVTLGGVFVSARTITTKKGERMAFLNFEDLTGSIEMIMFPKIYREFAALLHDDKPLLVKGVVDRSQESAKIRVEGLSSLTTALERSTRSIHLDIPLQELTKSKIDRVVEIIQKYQGESLVYFHLKNGEEYETVVEMPAGLSAMACEPLMHHIDRLFENKVVRFY